jgi:hypothetical protein
LHTLGNIRIIPFIASIALLILTYYITKQITQKRFCGIIAMIVLMQSSVFLTYDTVSSYENFWTVLYLFSLYLIQKKWYLSPIPYFLSILAKTLTMAFLPLTLFFILSANIEKSRKIKLALIYVSVIVILVTVGALLNKDIILGGGIQAPDSFDFWVGFTAMAMQIRFDWFVLVFLLPVIVALFFVSKKMPVSDSVMFLIFGMVLYAPLLPALTDITNQPYRFVPLVVFFAIGIGVLFSKKPNQQV